MVRKRRLQAEKGRQPPCLCACPFRSHTVINYTAPTSNLDSLNEAVILKSLREGQDGKTVALVSHRQSTMRIADTVYSVESLSWTGRSS